jgi:hypothetical protein
MREMEPEDRETLEGRGAGLGREVGDGAVEPARIEGRKRRRARGADRESARPPRLEEPLEQAETGLTARDDELGIGGRGRRGGGCADDLIDGVPAFIAVADGRRDGSRADEAHANRGAGGRGLAGDCIDDGPALGTEECRRSRAEDLGEGERRVDAREMAPRLDRGDEGSAHTGASGELRLGQAGGDAGFVEPVS